MLNILSDATLSQAADVTGQWVVRALHAPTNSKYVNTSYNTFPWCRAGPHVE